MAATAVLTVLLLATPLPWLAIAPPLLLFSLLILARHPEVGFYAIVATIPFWSFRALPGPLAAVPVHWLLASLLVAILLLRHAAVRRVPEGRASNLWGRLALFAGISLVSAHLSPHRATAMNEVVRLALSWVLVALGLIFVDERGFRSTLPAVLVVAVSVSSALALAGYFFGLAPFASVDAGGLGDRGAGGASGPVNLAFLIVTAAPLLVHRILFPARPGERPVALGLLGLNLLGLVVTFSRGGALILALVLCGLLLELLPRMRLAHVLGLVIALCLVTLAVAPLVPERWWQRQKSVVAAEDRSMQRRLSYLTVAEEAVGERPVLGWGPGAFREIYARTPWARQFQREEEILGRHAHNTYVEVLVGTGAVGLAAFVALIAVALRNFTRARRRLVERGETELALLVASYRMCFLAVLAFFLLKSAAENKVFLLLLALSSVAVRLSRSKEAVAAPAPARS